ncbi:MAG: restriction endonuclease [Bacillota bacterium]
MLTQQTIIDFCNSHNYDIRISGNGRWIDQKCAADVVTVIADCIYNYELEKPSSIFTAPDIWHYTYAVENVEVIFKKPDVESDAARNEYDKFFQQPMEMLANAGVLTKIKKGARNFYQVANQDVLEYIALREKNALFFLKTYIEKVLTDSSLTGVFHDFFHIQTKENYETMKKSFSDFTIKHTKINGELECNRIFTKVLNPLAYFQNALGTEKGRLSKHKITYDMLMYNRNNFRDIYSDKPKGVTRKEYATAHPVQTNDAYYRYQSIKAKKFLKLFNEEHRNGKTEHIEERHLLDHATHIHHIFPEADHPEICFYLENLIALTPTQHLNYAHPNGRTQEINEQYQHLLLLSKADRIHENLTSVAAEHIYDFTNFLFVLNVGFDNDDVLNISDLDFSSVVNAINLHYVA